MKVYTRTGDDGSTGLIGGTRVEKNDVRLEAYGTVDELNAYIGLLLTYSIPQDVFAFLQIIQNELFIIGSYLATDSSKVEYNKNSLLGTDSIQRIEEHIDLLDSKLPVLNSFILPGGARDGAICHICRTVARRAERRLYDLDSAYSIGKEVLVYVNRLSDYFFVLSRFLTINAGGKEILWKKLN